MPADPILNRLYSAYEQGKAERKDDVEKELGPLRKAEMEAEQKVRKIQMEGPPESAPQRWGGWCEPNRRGKRYNESWEDWQERVRKAKEEAYKEYNNLRAQYAKKVGAFDRRYLEFETQLRTTAKPLIKPTTVYSKNPMITHFDERDAFIQPEDTVRQAVEKMAVSPNETAVHNVALMISNYVRWYLQCFVADFGGAKKPNADIRPDWGSRSVMKVWEKKLPIDQAIKILLEEEVAKGQAYVKTASKFTPTDWKWMYYPFLASPDVRGYQPYPVSEWHDRLQRSAKWEHPPYPNGEKETKVVIDKLKSDKDVQDVFNMAADKHWNVDVSEDSIRATLEAVQKALDKDLTSIQKVAAKSWTDKFMKVEPPIHKFIALMIVGDDHEKFTDTQLAQYKFA